jgi:hypothetical protein
MRLVVIALAVAAAAFAADVNIHAAGGGGSHFAPSSNAPGTTELSWDNGTWKYLVWWTTGEGSWVGNDFDLSTVNGTRLEKVRLLSSAQWPNDSWEGFNLALYDLRTGTPGSMMWPASGEGSYYKPAGVTGTAWVEVPVGWVTTAPKFVAAVEQFYNHPNCDPFAVDTNPTFLKHSWMYCAGIPWRYMTEVASDPYFNLMLRLTVSDGVGRGVAVPTSWGRIKAAYY